MGDGLKIKVCGMKEPGNLARVCELGVDFIGYIFFRASARYVGENPDEALFQIPRDRVSRVGVFVDEPLSSVRTKFGEGCLDVAQLHGSESPAYCKSLVNEGIHVIKAIGPEELLTEGSLEEYYGVVHYFLFDAAARGKGGTGKKFDWGLLEKYTLPVPFLLSGGIGPEDGEALRKVDHLMCRGVDVNSRFEDAPGVKNIEKLDRFIAQIRK